MHGGGLTRIFSGTTGGAHPRFDMVHIFGASLRMRIREPIRAFTLLIILYGVVPADVQDSSATGFTSVNRVTVAAIPSVVWEKLTRQVSQWWDPAHTWSGDAGSLSIDARAGGLFREVIPEGGDIAHMAIVYAHPGSLLRMSGGLGPLQGMAVTGYLTWQLKDVDGMTEVTLTYAVTGYHPGGMAMLSGPVDGVLKHQLGRLKRYIETGTP